MSSSAKDLPASCLAAESGVTNPSHQGQCIHSLLITIVIRILSSLSARQMFSLSVLEKAINQAQLMARFRVLCLSEIVYKMHLLLGMLTMIKLMKQQINSSY